MKIIFMFKSLILSSLLLSGCIFSGGGLDTGLIVAASERENKNKNRAEQRRRRESSGAKCGEARECEDICEEVYNDDNEDENEGKVKTCLEVKYKLAIQFEDILDILEEPYESSLRNIEEDAFFEFLDVSLQPWVDTTKGVSSSEAKALLIWIAREPEISQAIYDAYRNYEKDFDLYEGVKNLFKELPGTGDNAGKVTNCNRSIVGNSQGFKDIVIKKKNCKALTIYKQVCTDQEGAIAGCT